MKAGRSARVLLGTLAVAAAMPCDGMRAADKANPDWPCIQRKVVQLSPAQFWDGPPLETASESRNLDSIQKLAPYLASRRVTMEDARAALARFAGAEPAQQRDQRLTALFAVLLDLMGEQRRTIIGGIERFHRNLELRSRKLQEESTGIVRMREQASKDEKGRLEIAQAQDRYDWDARVFNERQRSIPIACEIPVNIEARIFELARAIREHMTN